MALIMIKIFIIHGNFSGSNSMKPLEEALKNQLQSDGCKYFIDVEISNKYIEFFRIKYKYTNDLISCAREVYKSVNYNISSDDLVFLVGHSQGGLVARLVSVIMTNCNLRSPYSRKKVRRIDDRAYDDYLALSKKFLPKCPPKKSYIDGVTTLGSPHAGSLTMGQFSTAAGLFAKAIQGISSLFAKNLKDLSSDRLPRLMQYMSVPETNFLSISGSRINRYSFSLDGVFSDAVNLNLPKVLSESALVPNFSVQLSKPNDLIVEEESADLSRSLLPFEGQVEPEHFNCYVNATSVTHFNICADNVIAEKVIDWITGIASKHASR